MPFRLTFNENSLFYSLKIVIFQTLDRDLFYDPNSSAGKINQSLKTHQIRHVIARIFGSTDRNQTTVTEIYSYIITVAGIVTIIPRISITQ